MEQSQIWSQSVFLSCSLLSQGQLVPPVTAAANLPQSLPSMAAPLGMSAYPWWQKEVSFRVLHSRRWVPFKHQAGMSSVWRWLPSCQCAVCLSAWPRPRHSLCAEQHYSHSSCVIAEISPQFQKKLYVFILRHNILEENPTV